VKVRIATIAVIGLLTLSAIAMGFSALGETRDASAATSNASIENSGKNNGDNVAVTAFKFV
jgi:hypothetical protein